MSFLKKVWYVAAHAQELNEGLVSRKICDQQIVMFRTSSGAIAALEDRCPHRFVPLSMGKRIGDTLQCGYHGLSFDSSGACSDAPNDDEQQRRRICVKAYTAVERYAIIWLWFGSPETADPDLIPAFDFITRADYAVARGHSYIKANHEILADNLLDLSHVHYLHPGIMGDSNFADFTNKVKVEGDTVWSMLWRHRIDLDEVRRKGMGLNCNEMEGQGHSRWNAPGNLLVDTAFWERGKTIDEGAARSPSAHLLTPETEYTSHYFWLSGRNFDIDNTERTAITERGNRHIFETQDGPMCEAQQAALGTTTDFLSAQPMILRADAAGLAARRIMKRKRRQEQGEKVGEKVDAVEV
jgi:phenylpropionate dioxygenase-like ring-hydroxylating dioxygenase large terminal subunit